MPAPVDGLLRLLELEDLDVDLYRGTQPETTRQRVFGGQVAAQALVAGARSVDTEYSLHSLHSYFLRPGDTRVPIIYDVERIRDGRSFATRRVVARQHGRGIYFLTANYQRAEDGLDHQDVMPDVPGPDAGYPMSALARRSSQSAGDDWDREWSALDIRHLGTSTQGLTPDPAHPAQARLWVRVDGDVGEDPITHLAAFTYASDLTLLGAALVPHDLNIASPRLQPASLDHTIWFHRPFRA
ncbi:acyl-CoA thioesterase II, partial [uncultured Nocardioides sp.]|uniref:acyl-CoA thioesterase n=1 Tax=uncultured Nocardioides sp. TaxID=198441 RepID=UPI0025E98718